jgi:hypothetical protein
MAAFDAAARTYDAFADFLHSQVVFGLHSWNLFVDVWAEQLETRVVVEEWSFDVGVSVCGAVEAFQIVDSFDLDSFE